MIFVSIASYRDPETKPTILDLLSKAKNPGNISIGVCLQNELEDMLLDIKHEKLKILNFNWRESQGTCWARHNIQKLLYDNEKYYFQIDSHHRFCENWDEWLIETIEQLRSNYAKPIIGGYCPSYKPDKDTNLEDRPMRIHAFADFSDLGDLMFSPKVIKDFQLLRNNNISTIPARFLSGHFIFADSAFIKECPYDPNLYFRGEELSLSARAYTSGYDLFHPVKPIVWHEYTRPKQRKHWIDHTSENGFIKTWKDRANSAKARARYLLGIENNNKINFGKYGLGTERTLHDYELYAGLKFATKQVHKYAYDTNNVYPNARVLTEDEWSSGLMKKYKVLVLFDQSYTKELKSNKDIKHITLIFHGANNDVCYRKDIRRPDIQKLSDKLYLEVSMENTPYQVFVRPQLENNTYLNKVQLHHKLYE